MVIKANRKNFDEAFENNYLKIKESLIGLEEIFRIKFLEKNLYYQIAKDNINSLHENIINLFKVLYDPRQVRQKLRELKYDELEAQEGYLDN